MTKRKFNIELQFLVDENKATPNACPTSWAMCSRMSIKASRMGSI